MARRPFLALLAILTVALAVPYAGSSSAASRYKVISQSTPVTGLTYKKLVDSVGPNRIAELIVDPQNTKLTMDVALAGDQLGHYEKTTSMASRHTAIAAINGDFGIWPGYPSYGFAEDGDFKVSRTSYGANFAVSQDEQDIHIGRPAFHQRFEEVDTGQLKYIDRWNLGVPSGDDIVGYTPAGGSFAKPPNKRCYAQLAKSGGLMWGSTGVGVIQPYVVKAANCQQTALPPTYGATLVAMPGTEPGIAFKALADDEAMRVSWDFSWPNVMDVLGGFPMLMRGGDIVATNCSEPVCARHPRTGVGFRPDGKILMVVVDGRWPGYSVGMTLLEFAQLFRYLGAETAMNLDGGGSSTMVLQGKIKNHPSDGSERAVTTALLVLNGRDKGEPVTAPWGTNSLVASGQDSTSGRGVAVPSDQARAAGLLAALDGGSTGGMVDAVASGAFGNRPDPLPSDYLEVLRLFRGRLGAGRV